MPSIIKIKRSSNTAIPMALAPGELAYSWNSDKLFIGTGTDITGEIAPNIEVIGGSYFTDKLDHTPGILTANSAIIVDANKEIDELFVRYLNITQGANFTGDIIANSITVNSAIISDNLQANVAEISNLIVQNEIESLNVKDLSISGTFSTDDITSQTVNVLGNLNVIGAITSIYSETLNLADNIILLNSNLESNTQPVQDSGFTVNRGAEPNVSFLWDETLNKWSVGTQDFIAANFIGDVIGNASTASKLQYPITFALANTVTGSVSFDGSANVTIDTQIDVLYGGTY